MSLYGSFPRVKFFTFSISLLTGLLFASVPSAFTQQVMPVVDNARIKHERNAVEKQEERAAFFNLERDAAANGKELSGVKGYHSEKPSGTDGCELKLKVFETSNQLKPPPMLSSGSFTVVDPGETRCGLPEVIQGDTTTDSAITEDPSLHERFRSVISDYQESPSRESAIKVIELYKQISPLPIVPEEAREPFVMGGTMLRKACKPAEAEKAIELFTQSLNVAPWFAEAYYNRALAYETVEQFVPAMDDLNLYLEFKLTPTERRGTQDKIYSLKADDLLAATRKYELDKLAQEKAAAEKERLRPTVEGKWSNTWGYSFQVVRSGDRFTIIRGAQLGIKAPNTWRARDVVVDRQNIRFQMESDNPEVPATSSIELTLSSDGSKLVGGFSDRNGVKTPMTAFTRVTETETYRDRRKHPPLPSITVQPQPFPPQ